MTDEEKGQIFLSDAERKDSKLVAQTGIGQQNVRITPLQAANMMATIAREEKRKWYAPFLQSVIKTELPCISFPKKIEG